MNGMFCARCGYRTCAWDNGEICEGWAYPNLVTSRDIYEALPWYKRLFRDKPATTIKLPKRGEESWLKPR